MKIPVYNLKGESGRSADFARVFSAPVRTDIIARAVVSELSKERQSYGTDPLAGKRTSAHYHGRRQRKHTMMNREMARMARVHGSGYMHMTARFVPQATKGRKAHPPKVEKVWEKKINRKERMKAIFSAVSATANKEFVLARGHKVEAAKHIPIVVENSIESLKSMKEFAGFLGTLGLEKEIDRVKEKKVRSGKGTIRGRVYKKKKGPLVVVSEFKGIEKAARNFPGVDVVKACELAVRDLAPGGLPGRLTIWSQKALEQLEKKAGGQHG